MINNPNCCRERSVTSRFVRTAFEKLAWLVLAVALSLTCASVANAKSIYVSLTGTDNRIGTLGWPVQTIAQAMKIAVQGETVIVRDGTYSGIVRIGKGGTASNPVKIITEHKGMAIIQGSSTAPDTDLVVIAASNVTFDGFDVRNATRSGIAVWASSKVTISNNCISGSQRSGIWAGGPGLGQSKHHQQHGDQQLSRKQETQLVGRMAASDCGRCLDVSHDLRQHRRQELRRRDWPPVQLGWEDHGKCRLRQFQCGDLPGQLAAVHCHR